MVDSFDFTDDLEDFRKMNRKESEKESREQRDNRLSKDNRENRVNSAQSRSQSQSYLQSQSHFQPSQFNYKRPKFTHSYQQHPRPFAPRQTPFYSRNYKDQVDRPLPKFTSTFRKYRNEQSVEILGYRNPRFEGRRRPTAGMPSKNISRTFFATPASAVSKSTLSSPNPQKELISPPRSFNLSPKKASAAECDRQETIPQEDDDDQIVYHFRVKVIDSYREFCRIKSRNSLSFPSKYDSISFLKSLTLDKDDKVVILAFFDRVERLFYGAAVVMLDEIAGRMDTETLEDLNLRLNWIYLSDVEESELNLPVPINCSHPGISHLDQKTGLDLLKLLEHAEIQLHDYKKIKPVRLRTETAERLGQLEEFFRLRDAEDRVVKEMFVRNETETIQETKISQTQAKDTFFNNSCSNTSFTCTGTSSPLPSINNNTNSVSEDDDDFFADYQ